MRTDDTMMLLLAAAPFATAADRIANAEAASSALTPRVSPTRSCVQPRAIDSGPWSVCELGVKAAAAADALLARGFRTVLSVDGGLWAGEPWLAFELE